MNGGCWHMPLTAQVAEQEHEMCSELGGITRRCAQVLGFMEGTAIDDGR